MDSWKDKNGKRYVYCHECEFGGNGKLKNCNVGKEIRSNPLNRGCWAGELIEGLKQDEEDEIHNSGNTAQ